MGPATVGEWEAGDEGLELIAFGGHCDDEGNHMRPGWWTDQAGGATHAHTPRPR